MHIVRVLNKQTKPDINKAKRVFVCIKFISIDYGKPSFSVKESKKYYLPVLGKINEIVCPYFRKLKKLIVKIEHASYGKLSHLMVFSYLPRSLCNIVAVVTRIEPNTINSKKKNCFPLSQSLRSLMLSHAFFVVFSVVISNFSPVKGVSFDLIFCLCKLQMNLC